MYKQKTKKKAGATAKTTKAEKVNSNSVNGRRALYMETAANFHKDACEMVQSGVSNLQAGVCEMQMGIHDQTNKFKEGTAAFQSGVAEILSSIAAMQASIAGKVKENQEYTRKFYG